MVVGVSIRSKVEPRDVPPVKAARRLGLTLPEFELVNDSLLRRGFPRPDPTTGLYDLVKIENWMDARDLTIAPQQEPRPLDASEILARRSGREK